MTDSPRVVLASGHMVDAPARETARFPSHEVARVETEVGGALERWGVGPDTTLVAGAARGADLIAAEGAHKLGAQLHVVLALPVEEFLRRSVGPSDGEWAARFRRVLDAASVEVVAGADDGGAFERANTRMVEVARAFDRRPHAVVVWDGKEGDAPGGTRDLILKLGYVRSDDRVHVVDPTFRAYQGRQASTGPKKLLALDGGGIRGVLSLEVLAALEEKLRRRYGRTGEEYVLADYFDYIGGTSTGAIIAAGLALGKPVATIRSEYEDLGPRVFRKRALPLRLRSLYRDHRLTMELRNFFGADRTLGDSAFRSLLLLVLHNSVTDSVWPLSNCTQAKYNRADRCLGQPPDRNLDLPLVELIRGSTAAPVYFPPQELSVGAHRFVFQDGGVTPFNNPAVLMFLMSALPEYGLGWPVGEDRMLIVSIGTGAAPVAHPGLLARKVNIGFQAKHLPGVFMSGASAGQDLVARSLGRTRAGEPIDREFGSRADAAGVGGRTAFSYLRYNADLSPDALAAAGIVDPKVQKNLRKLDSVQSLPELQALGRQVGEKIELDRHFRGFL